MKEIYLDANATTSVLPQARAAALGVMTESFGNPSSVHGTGLRARAILDEARAVARRVLGIDSGRVIFTSGATEGIQTAILSALTELRRRRDDGRAVSTDLLYGATEHKAVPEALRHWNAMLGLDFSIRKIPVDSDGRHDLAWLREAAPFAGLVCTMAANNETGVISDLDGIEQALSGSDALWLVDSVQALGKLSLDLARRRIDYAPFSGHKLYAPKGVGLLYVRDGSPFSPMLMGGGQEGELRAGTENMTGIAALGAVLLELERGTTFKDAAALNAYRSALTSALREAFPDVVLNAPEALSLPTTLNFSVPGLTAKQLLDAFDSAGVRLSGGSACSAAKAQPSYVLAAMGLPDWQAASAIRLSFGPADTSTLIDEACSRIKRCAEALRSNCLSSRPQKGRAPTPLVTRFVVDGACCYLVADTASMRCVVIDPLPELTADLTKWIQCRGFNLAAVLDTHSHGDHASSAADLRASVTALLQEPAQLEPLGWPAGTSEIQLGHFRMTQIAVPGHTRDSTSYVLHKDEDKLFVFVGDTVMPGSLGRSDFEQSEPLRFATSLLRLEEVVGSNTLLLPGHDYDDRFATTLSVEREAQPLLDGVFKGELDAGAFAVGKAELERDLGLTAYQTVACGARVGPCSRKEAVEIDASGVVSLLDTQSQTLLVDVREIYEQLLGLTSGFGAEAKLQAAPLSGVLSAMPAWLDLPQTTPVVFVCRSGNRSAQVARALRALGRTNVWSLRGGLALWPGLHAAHRQTELSSLARPS